MFICFAGIDGAGKSTLAKSLTKNLRKEGIKAIYVYNRYIPIILRPIIHVGNFLFLRNKDFYRDYIEYSNTKKTALKKHSLLASLYYHTVLFEYFISTLLKVKIPLLLRKNVVCDRYIYDTITDLSVDLNYSKEAVKNFLDKKILSLFPTPDITFLIDLPEEIAYQRKKDIPSVHYLKDRRKIYSIIRKECKMITLDGSRKLGELQCEIDSYFNEPNI